MAAVDPAVIMNNFDTIGSIIETTCIIMGIFLVLSSFFGLKRYGEQRTMMSQQMSLAGPGMMLVAGVMLLILPTTIASLVQTFWNTTTPLSYSSTSASGYAQYVPVILMFVRLIGVISIIRGITLVSRAGGQNSQPGTIGRAMIHILGGLLAVHILGTIDLLKSILDITIY